MDLEKLTEYAPGDGPVYKKDLTWTSLDSSVAYVDSAGNVISVSAGIVEIIPSYQNLVSDTMVVTVKAALRPITNDPFINVPADSAVHEVPVLIISFIPTADNIYVDRSFSPNLTGTLETVAEFDSLVAYHLQ